MAVVEESISKILSILSHPIRRKILRYIGDKGEQSFTELMKALKIDTGKMSFHMKSLRELLEQTPSGKYKLSNSGHKALELISDLEDWAITGEIKSSKEAYCYATLTQRSIAFFIDFSLALIVFLLPSVITNFFLSGMIEGFTLDFNFILFLALFWLYLTLLEGFSGQSLGKVAIRLKVIRVDGKDMSYENSAIRNIGKCFLLPLDLIAGHQLKNKRFLRYFDKFAGTTVVDLLATSRKSDDSCEKEQ
jgi:uncharacterized RDD family membrane protein YckC